MGIFLKLETEHCRVKFSGSPTMNKLGVRVAECIKATIRNHSSDYTLARQGAQYFLRDCSFLCW